MTFELNKLRHYETMSVGHVMCFSHGDSRRLQAYIYGNDDTDILRRRRLLRRLGVLPSEVLAVDKPCCGHTYWFLPLILVVGYWFKT